MCQHKIDCFVVAIIELRFEPLSIFRKVFRNLGKVRDKLIASNTITS